MMAREKEMQNTEHALLQEFMRSLTEPLKKN